MGPRAIWREDLITSLLSVVLVMGLFLDGWNHINLQNGALGSFWTVWHALLYLGFNATAIWVVTRNPHLYTRGAKPAPYFHPIFGIPLRYPLAIGGLALATVGLFGDLAWHTAFGEETGVARVIAPFHLFLFAGAAGLASAPLRSAWYAPRYYPTASSFRRLLPPLIALTLVTCVAAFMFQWLDAFLDWTPSVEIGRIPPDLAANARVRGTTEFAGAARILVTNLILLAPIFLALRRWRLPFGSATLLFVTVSFETGAAERIIVVPRAAVQTLGDRAVVYIPVNGEEGKFIERTVKLGAPIGEFVPVLDGLKAGDKVVTDGSFFLRAEATRTRSGG